jgi:hypothetical protein
LDAVGEGSCGETVDRRRCTKLERLHGQRGEGSISLLCWAGLSVLRCVSRNRTGCRQIEIGRTKIVYFPLQLFCLRQRISFPNMHLYSWKMNIIDKADLKEEVSMILYGCWSVWKWRNSRKHGEGGRSVTESVRWTTQTSLDR